MGRPKAAVLPVPVWARATTSFSVFSSSGIACSWTGVGVVKPISVRERRSLRAETERFERGHLSREKGKKMSARRARMGRKGTAIRACRPMDWWHRAMGRLRSNVERTPS